MTNLTPLEKLLALLLSVSVGAAAGCSAHRDAGTGDVAFRLTWRGLSDLDLFVEDPGGACVFFGNRQSTAGGMLDRDCSGGAQTCEHPIENVFWPAASAPAGVYQVWVHAHSLVPSESPLSYELQVLRGKTRVFEHRGTLHDHEELHGPFVHAFPAGRGAALSAARPLPPSCTSRIFPQPDR